MAIAWFLSPVRAAEAEIPGLEGIPEIVAEVDGKPIKRFELIRELVGASGTKAIERLVDRVLVEQEAKELRVVVTDQDIEIQYKKDELSLSEDLAKVERDIHAKSMEDTIRAKYRMSVAEYKNIVIRQRLLARACMAADIRPSDADLRKFYDAYPDLFQPLVRYRAAHILITPLDPRDILQRAGQMKGQFAQMQDYEERIRKLREAGKDDGIEVKDDVAEQLDDVWRKSRIDAEQLVRTLQAYPNRWNDYVRRYSRDPMDQLPTIRRPNEPAITEREKLHMQPGEVGWFHKRGPMVKEFYEGAKNIKPGEIGGPIRTQFGWHIVKMLEVKFPDIVTFAQCKEKARELFIENEIQLRSPSWLAQLVARADLKTERATLWPPKPDAQKIDNGALPDIAFATNGGGAGGERDPIVGRVNGVPLRRSEIWRDLLQTEGEEALQRLINREVVLNIVKTRGVAYMEWLCSDPSHRALTAPAVHPIKINIEDMQKELNDDRLALDELVNGNKKYAGMTFADYIYERYGQSEADYNRAIEATLVLREAIRQKVVPRDKRDWENTLKLEFAMARSQYSQSPWFEISHIMIVPSGGMLRAKEPEQQAALMIADRIYQQLQRAPDSFAQMVEQYSDDTAENKANHGKLGPCYSDVVPLELPESLYFFAQIKALNLEAGQFTPPLKSARGYHIVRLDRKHPAIQADYAEKRDQVERDYINEQAKYYADVWVRALNSRAIVKHFLYKPNLFVEPNELPENFNVPKD